MSFVGMDWSGTPEAASYRGQEFYICCAVRMTDVEETDAALKQVRQDFGLPKTTELHGYHSGARLLKRALRLVLETGQVTALILDKATLDLPSSFALPAVLPAATALCVLEHCFAAGVIRRLWCDQDIHELAKRRAFNTRIFRMARGEQAERIDIKHYPSHKSSLIQLADMTAYALQRSLRGALETDELQRLMQTLQRKFGNLVRSVGGDDLRPYLLP